MDVTKKTNPEHYKPHGIMAREPITILKDSLTPDAYRGYLMGCVIKYISRYDRKDGLYDLAKAKVYISFLEADLKGEGPLTVQYGGDENPDEE